MLEFFRKYATQILSVTIFLFAGSIVMFGILSTFFLSDTGGGENVKVLSQLAEIEGLSLDETRFQRRLGQTYMQLSEEQREYLDPNLWGRLKNRVFEQQLQFEIMLKEANENELTVTRQELKFREEQLLSAYKVESKTELRKLLANQNVKYSDFIDEQKNDIKVQKLIQSIVGGVKVLDKDLDRAFKEIEVSHILFEIPEPKVDTDNVEFIAAARVSARSKVLQKAEDVYEQVLGQPGQFSAFAKRFSDDSSSSETGKLGWFTFGQLEESFEDVAFNLDKGDIGGPVETSFGFHLVMVNDLRYRDRPEDLDDDRLKQALLKDKQDKTLSRWIKPKRDELSISFTDLELEAYDYRVNGKLDLALGAYQKLQSRQPNVPIRHMMIAEIYRMMGRADDANTSYQRGLILEEMAPDLSHPSFHFSLASFYHDLGESENVSKTLAQIEDIDVDNLYVFSQLKNAYERYGYDDDAQRIVERIGFIEEERKAASEPSPFQTGDDFSPLIISTNSQEEG
jgi:foldase protein PrsA